MKLTLKTKDGKTGIVYCVDCDTPMEVYAANVHKAVETIRSEKRLSHHEAIDLLQASDIDNPVKLSDCEFWVE